MKSYIVAISGASGAIYGIRLVEELLKAADTVHLCISGTAFSIIKTETILTGLANPNRKQREAPETLFIKNYSLLL